MNTNQGALRLGEKWLPAFLLSQDITSDDEHQTESNLHSDQIIAEVQEAVKSQYQSYSTPKLASRTVVPSITEEHRYNDLLSRRVRKEQELGRLKQTLDALQQEFARYADKAPECTYSRLSTRFSALHARIDSLRYEAETYEFMLSRYQTSNSVLYARTNRLKSIFSSVDSQVRTALNVIQIDENWTLSFTQQRNMIESNITAMRTKRLETLAEMMNAAETARKEVNERKTEVMKEKIRLIKSVDRRERLKQYIIQSAAVCESSKALKHSVRAQLQALQNRSDLFEKAFQTRDPLEISKKFKDVVIGNDLLQRNVEDLLVNQARLKREYNHLRSDLSTLIMNHRRSLIISPKKQPRGMFFPAILRSLATEGKELAENVYHWLNSLGALLTRIAQIDTHETLGVRTSILLLCCSDAWEVPSFDYSKQAAKIFLLLEKKLTTAQEIAYQRCQTRPKKRKVTVTGPTVATEERIRMKLIAEQHFIQNPPASIQSLIGSYASAVQKEVMVKHNLQRQSSKTMEWVQTEREAKDNDYRLGKSGFSGQLTSKARMTRLPFLDDRQSLKTDRSTPKPTSRDVVGELRQYVTSRTREIRKSASTEGLVDFLREIHLRKRDLAHFLDRHKTHIRAFSQNSELMLEGSLKKTVSSMASTNSSAKKAAKVSPAKDLLRAQSPVFP